MRGRRSRRKRISGEYCAESAALFLYAFPATTAGMRGGSGAVLKLRWLKRRIALLDHGSAC